MALARGYLWGINKCHKSMSLGSGRNGKCVVVHPGIKENKNVQKGKENESKMS
jgi:hypothetical protein